MSGRKRVAVLISGRGSNMQALIEAAVDPSYPAEIVAVLSNRPDAGGLATAAAQGIGTAAVDHRGFASREAHEEALVAAIERFRPDIVCLAGYMRLLTADFTDRYAGRMINIHPSLLPLFPGLHTHERALDAGMRVHGCTVHFVTAGMDEGPIIAQAAIAIEAGDTPDQLATRLLAAEHRLYPHALALVATGAVRWVEGRAVLAEVGGVNAAAPTILVSPSRP
ncbi:phosphoribosylglycinamide formyltransferase [Aureimonas jatrophae]|uniref:Phosphoribosylglycinamide formyltransferase n=1 Tax=Aureimonas jatrophae TaxID=1166073 RepID=A0A1H0GBQ9_9HYPH|nr:phosphoribosylglycinamide formyltransferase [Aureimonas jatrophae]MBB3949497.1 phosphoribosylglycinamide formyltransferase-1 [Aureimonas jatrophae]SDO04209.1 phosphoribosylglycinamide formyltransferase-1 [Aureimonas jatrophae]